MQRLAWLDLALVAAVISTSPLPAAVSGWRRDARDPTPRSLAARWPAAQEVLLLAAQHGVATDYALSTSLLTDEESKQRIVEMLWPRRLRATAVDRFSLWSETPPPGCAIRDAVFWVQYASCR